MTQILILAAGAGSRFKAAGYEIPKPFLADPTESLARPILETVVEDCLREFGEHADVLVALPEGMVEEAEGFLDPRVAITGIPSLTDGAARTALACEKRLLRDEPLIVVNADQRFRLSAPDSGVSLLAAMDQGALDGFVLTMDAPGDPTRWSYVGVQKDWNGVIRFVVEKPPIPPSKHATVGVYGFARAKDCFDAIRDMIEAEDRVKGEFYFAPCINHLLAKGARFQTHKVASFIALGTPEDYEAAGSL